MRISTMCAPKTDVCVFSTLWSMSGLAPILFFIFGTPANAQVSELFEDEQKESLKHAFDMCSRKMETDPLNLTGLHCNRTWDNVMCWQDTPAGTVGYQSCPSYINLFDVAEFATKQCMENGTWYISPLSGKPWTNFSACIRKEQKENLPPLIVEHMPGVKLMSMVGYSLSLVALLLAVIIMLNFRRLRCPRNWIHLNMFFAFLLRAVFSLMKSLLLVNDLGFPKDVTITGSRIEFIQEGTHWECKLFVTLFYYTILASLMWLFNEGLFLVLILSVAVFAEKTKIRWFVLIGWGVPVVFVVPWVVCRIKLDDMLCWNVHVHAELFWILRGPMIASVGVNFVFFINIVRTLFTKLTAVNCPQSKKVRYRKLAKSTLILIPLFAVYYMGFIWVPENLSPASDLVMLYVEMLFNSFQGFLVALLFCFLNAEVQNEIRKRWHQDVQRAGDRINSWRSQPSVGSFLRRSLNRGDDPAALGNGKHRPHQQQHRPNRAGRGKKRFMDSSFCTTQTCTLGTFTATTSLPAGTTSRSGGGNGGGSGGSEGGGPCSRGNGHLVAICEETTPLTAAAGNSDQTDLQLRDHRLRMSGEAHPCCPAEAKRERTPAAKETSVSGSDTTRTGIRTYST